MNYDSLANFPSVVFYDAAQANGLNKAKPSYRLHTHYGTVGAIYAGMGGVRFPGDAYINSAHTALASCQDCHMATQTGRSGGHTFMATGNYAGCNKSGCHTDYNASSITATQNAAKTALNNLAAKLKVGGVDIMNRNADKVSIFTSSERHKCCFAKNHPDECSGWCSYQLPIVPERKQFGYS